MNRKLLNGLLVLAVATGGAVTFTSCKDESFNSHQGQETAYLQAQIDAIRALTDTEFRGKMEDWLNYLTDNYSDHGFSSFQEALACLNEMNSIYQDIMDGEPYSETTLKYVDKLYDALFNNEIKASDWYDLIFTLAEVRATSMELGQTYNPVFGSINLPIGLKTTLLASYVVEGSAADGYEFPTAVTNSKLNSAITSADNWAELQASLNTIKNLNPTGALAISTGDYTVANEGFGQMGAAYVSINPGNINFADSTVYSYSLVNSLGEEVIGSDYIKAEQNTDTLRFGIASKDATRAANTGIYKLNVDVPENFGTTIDILKDSKSYMYDVADAIKSRKISDLAYVGEQLYNSINNKLYAYSVKVSWKENVVDKETGDSINQIDNFITTNLDIAAATIHPLSYGSDLAAVMGQAGLTNHTLPVWGSLDELLDKIQGKIKLPIKDIPGVGDVNVDVVVGLIFKDGVIYVMDEKYTGGEDWQDHILGTIDYNLGNLSISEQELEDLVQAIIEAYDMGLSNGIQTQLADKLKDEINNAISSLNEQLSDLNAKVGDFFNYIRDHKAYDAANDLYKIYKNVATRINNFLKNPNHYLQVAAIYCDGTGHYHHLSTNPYDPTVVDLSNGGDMVEILATSYTGDIVVPSYQKYLAITAVDNAAATAADNTTAGEMINKVTPGQNQKFAIKVDGFKGKTFTLTYLSVDYSGVCSMQNYYVAVK